MTSSKTIKLSDNRKITFKFYYENFTIDMYLINTHIHLLRSHSDFNNTLNELNVDLDITNHKLKLIRYWHNKNYKKIYPNQEYITKSGRTVKPVLI